MNIVLVGNCQTWPISELITNHCSGVTVIGSIVVYRSVKDDEEKDLELLKKADVIVSQLVTDTFEIEHIQSNNLKGLFPGKVIVIPNLFFNGQNPDLVYACGSDGNRLSGPIDAYHSESLITSWLAGHELNSITAENYISRNFCKHDMQKRVERSFKDLETREAYADISMSEYLREVWCDTKLFHTFNHPAVDPLRALVGRISKMLDLKFVTNDLIDSNIVDRLGAIQPPMEISMFEGLGMKFDRCAEIIGVPLDGELNRDDSKPYVSYSFKDYAELCFRSYDKQAAHMDEVIYTPSQSLEPPVI